MNTEYFERFRSSLLRCLSNLHFLEHFYEEFTGASPEVAHAFAHTDMERQKAMLNASMYQLMNLYEHNDEKTHKEVQQMGAVHGAYGHRIPQHLYDVWLNSLLIAVEAADPQYNASIETAWREVMGHGIDLMKASSHLYPETAPGNGHDDDTPTIITANEVTKIVNRLSQCSKEAAHRSDVEKDMEVTAFQFGQYRAYLHAAELLKDLIELKKSQSK